MSDGLKPIMDKAEDRREYQRKYYQTHKDKAQEYQRVYNLTHKKSSRDAGRKSAFVQQREDTQLCFNAHDMMTNHGDKCARMFNQVLSGERLFTM